MNFKLFIILLLMSSLTWAGNFSQNLPTYSQIYSPERNAFDDGRAAISLAQKTQRRVLIEVGGEWCSWCHILDTFLNKNPDIKELLHANFVLLKINVSEENDNKEFLSSFPKPLGYPHMYVADKNGSVLWSKDTADFLSDGKYNRKNFLTFIERWKIKENLKVSKK